MNGGGGGGVDMTTHRTDATFAAAQLTRSSGYVQQQKLSKKLEWFVMVHDVITTSGVTDACAASGR